MLKITKNDKTIKVSPPYYAKGEMTIKDNKNNQEVNINATFLINDNDIDQNLLFKKAITLI